METILPITSIPGWPAPLPGVMEALREVTPCSVSPDGLHVADAEAAQAFLIAYVGSLAELTFTKNEKLTQLAALFFSKFAAGFNYVGPDSVARTFQIDPTSQFNIDVQSNAALGAILNGEIWDADSYFIAADNSHMPLPTAQGMRTFAIAAKNYIKGLILNNRALKDQIIAANAMTSVGAINVDAGWPSNL